MQNINFPFPDKLHIIQISEKSDSNYEIIREIYY